MGQLWPRWRRDFSRFAALHLLFLYSVNANPPDEGVRLSLFDAVQQALAGNPEISMRRADEDSARGQLLQAGLRPNPRATVQTEDIRTGSPQAPFSFANSTEDYLLVGQTFEVAGKRSGRVRVAGASVQAAQSQERLTRRQIVARVTAAYWNAVVARRNVVLTEQSLSTYDEDIDYVQNRVKEGVAAEGDLIRLRIERSRVQATAIQADRDSTQARVLLFRAMGKGSFPAVTLTTNPEDIPAMQVPPIERVLSQRPEIAVAQAAVTQAENNIKLQQANGRPDPQVFLGYKRNTGYDTAYAAVQIDLPIHNRNQGNVSSAVAQLHAAQAQLQIATTSIRAEYESAVQAYEGSQRLILPIRGTIADAQDAERRARAAYREGALDILRLLDAERSRIQVELDYARALADLQLSFNTLQQATGESFRGESGQ